MAGRFHALGIAMCGVCVPSTAGLKAELHVHSLLLSSACWNFEPSQFLPSFLGSF